jgi:hypothetical protein
MKHARKDKRMQATIESETRYDEGHDNEQQLLVVEPPHIIGPFPVEDNPVEVQYEVVARLALPAKDAEVTPTVSFCQESRGAFLDVQWTTEEPGEPRGIWERSVTITVPRQFAVKGCRVVGDGALREQAVGQ